MRVLVYADDSALEWRRLLVAHGHTAIVLRPGEVWVDAMPADICLVVVSDPVAERFWIADLPAPMLLVTSALGPAYMLSEHVPSVRLICHSSRAAHALEDMVQMTHGISAGTLVLGSLAETEQVMLGGGGTYARN